MQRINMDTKTFVVIFALIILVCIDRIINAIRDIKDKKNKDKLGLTTIDRESKRNIWSGQFVDNEKSNEQNDNTGEAPTGTESAQGQNKKGVDKVDEYIVFFSWQSDIEELKKEIGKIIEEQLWKLSQSKKCNFKFDSDTRNVPGMTPIVSEVLEKIENCHIFICDLTPVTILDTNGRKKAMPNSNVMFELGYAMKCLPKGQIIGIVNKERKVGEMPLDINGFKSFEFSSEDNNWGELLNKEMEFSLDRIINSRS